MLTLVNQGLSPTLYQLFLDWQEECIMNMQHDMNETKAWNALILYLMELEKGTVKSNTC